MPRYFCAPCSTTHDTPRCPNRKPTRGPSSKVTGRRDWRKLKRQIIKRDNGICWICRESGADSVDHLQPVSMGGTNDPENLKAAHLLCNQQRGARAA